MTETRKIPVKKILFGLSKLQEYHYPAGSCSLFMLPDSRMFGVGGIFGHQPVFEKILKRKINSSQEFVDTLVAVECIKITVSSNPTLYLYVDVPILPTIEQKHTLEDLGMCEKYDEIVVDNLLEYAPGAPSIKYCRRLLKLEPYC